MFSSFQFGRILSGLILVDPLKLFNKNLKGRSIAPAKQNTGAAVDKYSTILALFAEGGGQNC